MSGIKEVATLAGVSISTVSNVLNGTKYVSPELVMRVEKAVKALNYEVDPVAASMKGKKTGMIGVITEDLCGVFYPYIVRGINEIAEEKGYKLMISDLSGKKGEVSPIERELELFQRFLTSRVDGIIFASAISGIENEYFVKLKDLADNRYKKTPIVSLERDLTMLGIDSVYFDGFANAQTATGHLADCGCRKICHIAGPAEMQIVQERIAGYRKCMKDKGLELDEERMIAYGDYTHGSGYECMEKLLDDVPDLDGVFCSNDQMAIGALRVLKERGKSIPEEVKLIGYDDVFVSSIVDPPISTIHIQKKTAGKKAAEILFDRIEHAEKSGPSIGIKLESRLIIRHSTMAGAESNWNLSDW